ncbi:hypothetical protein [Brevundimonas sp. LjRoot202]|uniref:hypothetical protein n=1 Tax=Brevundimonas sp. LjRoot202 TaxID=3342281 RepID=UPI003ECF6D04
MVRFSATIAACLAAMLLAPGTSHAEDQCRLLSRYDPANPPPPTHLVSFIFTGVEDELVVLNVDEAPLFEAQLTTKDWSTEFSGATQCLMAGRYWVNLKIGGAEGNLHFEVFENTTLYLSARDGVLTFNIWGPDAPGLD